MITPAALPRLPFLAAALVAGASLGICFLTGISADTAIWTAVLLSLLSYLGITDALTETVPDAATLALVGAGLGHAAATGATLVPLVSATLLLLGIGLLLGWLTKDTGGIGSGDFFLAAGVTAWFGPLYALDVLILTMVGLALHSIIARKVTVAVAPSMAIASAIIWIGGPIL